MYWAEESPIVTRFVTLLGRAFCRQIGSHGRLILVGRPNRVRKWLTVGRSASLQGLGGRQLGVGVPNDAPCPGLRGRGRTSRVRPRVRVAPDGTLS